MSVSDGFDQDGDENGIKDVWKNQRRRGGCLILVGLLKLRME